MLYVTEIFWMTLFAIFIRNFWRLVPSLKNQVKHERVGNPDIHRAVYQNIKKQVEREKEREKEHGFEPRTWNERREQIYAEKLRKQLKMNKIL